MYCQCGKEIESSWSGYSFVEYDTKGNIVFAICCHGNVVIDKKNEEISLCKQCFCMTYTIDGKCGKCKKEK